MSRVIAVFLSLVALFGCSKLENPTQVPIESIIALARIESTTLRGDGASRTVLEARVPADIDPAKRNVTFKATAGGFVGGDASISVVVPADNNGSARVTYIAPATFGPVTISAKVSDYTATLELPIQPAYPDTLIGDTSSAVAKIDGSAKPVITVLAQRGLGKVSSGIPIAFTAYQVIGGVTKTAGRFSGIDGMKTDANGKATATFAADSGDVEKTEPLFVRATTLNDAGAPLTFEIRLRIE
jgi:hypothetical protein